jgi:hypothetical protein
MPELLDDAALVERLSTVEGKIELLGKSKGIGFYMKGTREVPCEIYENAQLEHDSILCGGQPQIYNSKGMTVQGTSDYKTCDGIGYASHNMARRPIERIRFFKGPYAGRSVEV